MPIRWMPVLWITVIVVMTSGCGTCANTLWFTDDEGGMRVYGGVRADWEAAHRAAKPSPSEPMWLPIVDMPFSAVGDTVTLPITIPFSLLRLIHGPHNIIHSPQHDLKEAQANPPNNSFQESIPPVP
jgi:uncharacterized protein YceK